jgi:hypothetical protein
MKPKEFTAFKDEVPEPNKYIIVTNNIKAKTAHGEMSHVWLTSFLYVHEDGEISSFDDRDSKICNLTHWKYA